MEQLRILLVEDNSDDEALSIRMLRKYDPNLFLEVVRDGEEAIQWLDTHVEYPPIAVLLDLNLPKKSGAAVLHWVRSNPRLFDLPVAILASSDEPESVRLTYESGATATLTKPLTLDRVAALFESIRNPFGETFPAGA